MRTWIIVFRRLFAVGIPLALGVGAILYSGSIKSEAAPKETASLSVPVRVITLSEVDLIPRVTGYGVVAPAREWRAIARVEGNIIKSSPLLSDGHFVPSGTELLKIDDTDVRLTLAQLDAQMAALNVKDDTLNASLELSRADLAISESDLKRQQDLQDQGVTTRTARDQAARAELTARSKLTDIQNQLALNEAERAVLLAQRASSARSLDFMSVVAPFDVQIRSVEADLGQYVARGAVLFSADGTEAVEITAQFPIGQMGPLIRSLEPGMSVLDLNAQVELSQAGRVIEWPATVARVSDAIEARTQSARIVVRVDRPMEQAIAGERPPLRRDMFVEVLLRAPSRKALVAPSTAITQNQALVVSAQGKLEPREVKLAYTVDGLAIISGGLAVGDKLVVTDLSVAVPGMAVKPVEDKALAAALAVQASAQ
ncbi:multidrug resistance efflux pump [Litoreibacter halocynthiae]|uniref:Multidrug resistance efflux pump n=1 Tax=Litoreibacter halocynthiae TaxID=1242689 RepID=A0A4R7LEH3_9RHOB|nr:HlyD family efflux transporter periplasmic adaptor subunit [Litoreibacter halocynthiae]TDT74028.1 multidrug resistance efflux pump [Litoreibacter halocynthiae]